MFSGHNGFFREEVGSLNTRNQVKIPASDALLQLELFQFVLLHK